MKMIHWTRRALWMSLLIHAAVVPATAAPPCLLDRPGGAPALRVPAAANWEKAGSGLVGASTLYHVDDDAFWSRPQAIKSLRQSHIRTLRFPGGELADNYDWEKHAVERSRMWPKEAATDGERRQRTDYREFLAHAAAAGIQEVFFVVNVDGAFRAPGDREKNLRLYAERAARWVKAVKDGGRRVRYWEVGNEPYLAGFPLRADEYARALNVFAREMRAADPSILIGAAGPMGIDGVGFADRLDRERLEELRASGRSKRQLCPGLTREACIESLGRGSPAGSPAPWWPTVVANARDSFDFAVIHRYYKVDLERDSTRGGFGETGRLQRFKSYLRQAKGRPVPLALTEWNTPNEKRRGRLSEIEHLLNVAVQMGNSAVGGVDYAHYWPMRSQSGTRKPLLTDDGDLTPVSRLFGLFGDLLPEAEVAEQLLATQVYLWRMRRQRELGYVVVNMGPNTAQLELRELAGREIRVSTMTGNAEGRVAPAVECAEKIARSEPRWMEVPRQSVAVLRVLQ